MYKFILYSSIVLAMMFAYNVGFTLAVKSVKKYTRKTVKKIITKHGLEPSPKESQEILSELMDFLYTYTDDNSK